MYLSIIELFLIISAAAIFGLLIAALITSGDGDKDGNI